jgi:hypothetical protein
MKKRPKARVRSTQTQKTSSLQGWITLLLVLLLAVEVTDLYLDHFVTGKSAEFAQSDKTKPQTIQEESTPDQTREPTSGGQDATAIQQTVEKPAESTVQTPSASEIKLQILNGCGVRGIASRVRGIMRDRGFDVMSFGNAARLNYPQTLLLVRSEGKRAELAAEVVARSLGVDKSRIRIERDPSLVDIDVTVILGLDYKRLNL